MLDFEKLDQALERAVGVTPGTLLATASPTWANRFFLARERLSELSGVTSPDVAIERDQLTSFFGCAYGEHGFLARAGVLHTLQARLQQVAEALPRLAQEPRALGSLTREAAILYALADARLSSPKHPDDAPLLEQLQGVRAALSSVQGFASGAAQATRSLGVATGAASRAARPRPRAASAWRPAPATSTASRT